MTTVQKQKQWRSFEEARGYVHKQEIKNQSEWQAYSKSGQKPDDIPADPNRVYKSEFKGYGDWLGTGTLAPNRRGVPFERQKGKFRFLKFKGYKRRKPYSNQKKE